MTDQLPKYGWLVSIGQFFSLLIATFGAMLDALYIREGLLAIMQALQIVNNQTRHQRGQVGLDFQFGYTITAIDDFLLLILGCAIIAVVIGVEFYFRKGRPKGLLWKRVGRVLLIELAVFVAMLIILLIV